MLSRNNRWKVLSPVAVAFLLLVGLLWSVRPAFTQSAVVQAETEIEVRLVIEYVKAIGCFEESGEDCEDVLEWFARGSLNNQPFGTARLSGAEITPMWVITRSVEKSLSSITGNIQIWDEDSGLFDDNDKGDLITGAGEDINFTLNLAACIAGDANAISGNLSAVYSCSAPITMEGDGNTATRLRFRVELSTVTVRDEVGLPVPNAEIWRIRSGEKTVFHTNEKGQFFANEFQAGDTLIAAQLMYTKTVSDTVHNGWSYRVYLTSLLFDGEGEVQPCIVGIDACQNLPLDLTVKKRNPLVLYNLLVSVGWGTYGVKDQRGQESSFLSQLRRALRSASDVLFDVTDGQFAFGTVTVFDGRVHWDEADLQIVPSNYRRPWANAGGITRHAPYTYTSSVLSTTVFYPGHIRIGRAWDQFGNPTAGIDKEDSIRMLAHEFAHYALMLLDEYFYFDAENRLRSGQCPGSLMDNPYIYDANSRFPELPMRGSALWSDVCESTEQFLTHGESAWQTISRVYTDSESPPRWEFRVPELGKFPNPGPYSLPDGLTQIELPKSGATQNFAYGTGEIQAVIKAGLYERTYTGQTQVFMLRKNSVNELRVYPQGTVSRDGIIDLVGVRPPDSGSTKPNDRIVAMSWDGRGVAAKPYITGTQLSLTLDEVQWRPFVMADPLMDGENQLVAFRVEVSPTTKITGELLAVWIPLEGRVTVTDAVTLVPDEQGKYLGTIHLPTEKATDEGFLWVGEVEGGQHRIFDDLTKQTLIPVSVGGSPDSHKRSNPPKHPSSSDGYCDFYFPPGKELEELTALVLTPQNLPPLAATQKIVSSACSLSVPAIAIPFTDSVALTIYFNEEATRYLNESMLRIYHWSPQVNEWQLVENSTVSLTNHYVHASIDQPGLYIAMAQTPPQLTLTGSDNIVNVVTALTQTPTSNALKDCNDAAVLGLDGPVLERYYATAPSFVTNLHFLQPENIYFVGVAAECTIDLVVPNSGIAATLALHPSMAPTIETKQAITASNSSMPATLYGSITFEGQNISSGITVTAAISDVQYAQTQVVTHEGQSVFVLDIRADDPNTETVEGGQPGQVVTFKVGCAAGIVETANWMPGQAQAINLTLANSPDCAPDPVTYQVYLPMIDR